MTGLAYADTNRTPAQIPTARWVAVCVIAALIHGAPLLYFTLPNIPLTSDADVISVEFSDSVADLAEPQALVAPPPAQANVVAPKNIAPPTLEDPPAAAIQPPKVVLAPQAQQYSAAPKPESAKPESAAPAPSAESKPALREPDLPALNPKEMVAFDESKTTKEIPKEGYLSDRNSTAADRGPKNLPRGDPYIDKGESKVIRYLEKRGEGNLPAFAAAESSGSVKKEGTPDVGKGSIDERPADKKLPPKSAVLPNEVDPKSKPIEKTVVLKPVEAKPETPLVSTAVRPDEIKEETAPEKKIGREKTADGTEPLALNPEPAKLKPVPLPKSDARNARPVAVEKTLAPETPHPDESAQVAAVEKPRRNVAEDQLAAFAALIDGKGKGEGRGGDSGEKAGIPGRAGSKGHEGDGTLRPGHDDAVSDVTSVNLDSSASEFDEARFAKKYDAKTAYVKPLARRIDGKWKAEIVARNRFRLVRGAVPLKIVIRKDGSLVDVQEVLPRQSGMTDESVSIAKLAVQRAADPKSEPFSAELAGRETLEFVFTFLY